MTTALKIFDIDLNHINISKIIHTSNEHIIDICYTVDEFNNVYMSSNEIDFTIQFPALKIIDADTNEKIIVLSFDSYDILYNDVFKDFIKELNNTIIKKIQCIKYCEENPIEFKNIFSTYETDRIKTDVISFNYDNCKLFYNKEEMMQDKFDELMENLDNMYCKIIMCIDKIHIKENKGFIDWKILQMHIKHSSD